MTARLLLCTLLIFQSSFRINSEEDIRVGAIFRLRKGVPHTTTPEELAFRIAIDQVNSNPSLLPSRKLKGYVERAEPEEDYDNIFMVNKLLRQGISVLIGPMDSSTIPAIGPMLSIAQVPQILPLTSMDTSALDQNDYGYLLRMAPTEKLKAKVIVDIIQHFKWKRIAILGLRGDGCKEYSQGKNALRVLAREKEWDVVVDRLFPPDNKMPRMISPRQELNSLKHANVRIVVVFCPAWAVKHLLRYAMRFELIDEWAWIFSDLGQSDEDLVGRYQPVPSYMRGLMGLRTSVGKGRAASQARDAFEQGMSLRNKTATISASAGHVYDSVLVAAQGIAKTLKQGAQISNEAMSVGFCSSNSETIKKGGNTLYRNMKKTMMPGFMSELGFEENGEARSASFDILNLRKEGTVKIGEWDTHSQLDMDNNTSVQWMSNKKKIPLDIPNYLKNKTIDVVAVLAPPFVMKKTGSGSNGTQEYEGLSIDMLEEMKQSLGFSYKLYLAPDGQFGSRSRTSNKWNGIMGEIIDDKAKLSIAPLTISSEGQTVVDFTHPYMTFGVAFVMRVKDVEENYFRFLTPYHSNLWLSICVMLFAMGIVLWIFSLLSPYGYYGRYAQHPRKHKVDREIKQSKNTLSLVSAIWSSFLCYLSQGGEQPASLSGKIAVSVFWFAIMIINATYTANLAAHLTVSRMQTPIETVEDLAHQTTIEYGTLMNSQLQNFFMRTDVPRFLVMGQFMEQRKTWMPDIQTAIDRVMNSNFAFISDRPILEYIARQPEYCGKLKVIGGQRESLFACKRKRKRGKCHNFLTFGSTYGYGFALPLNSPITNLFNMEIFRLQRDLIIDRLKHKWTYKTKCEMIDKMKEMSGKDSGIALGWVFMIFEWVYAAIRDTAYKKHRTMCEAVSFRLGRVCKDIWCKEEKRRESSDTEDEATTEIPRNSHLSRWAVLRTKDDLVPMRTEANGSVYDVKEISL
ncbi:glutamate receptor ionotropic, kainate 2 isoform X2 [Nematostella vectensis]|uniref:glutamate receptor ionotropic, kainate 2 isoform X2 n=1 Tax=Nematostella vectensis TaxID=45351 RepID=UPI0020778D3A|nr:glutamate receptor ionotropic, kainate 2 isoform X2 [Nematostella vectensis]